VVVVCSTPQRACRRAGQAMTSCRLQSNHSSTVTLHGGPVVLRRHLVFIALKSKMIAFAASTLLFCNQVEHVVHVRTFWKICDTLVIRSHPLWTDWRHTPSVHDERWCVEWGLLLMVVLFAICVVFDSWWLPWTERLRVVMKVFWLT